MVMLASSGWAAPTDVFDQIQMELLPVGSVSGDGLTPVNLHVLLMDVDGKPLDGALLKASATSGPVSYTHLTLPTNREV